jgi:hypothetical protein
MSSNKVRTHTTAIREYTCTHTDYTTFLAGFTMIETNTDSAKKHTEAAVDELHQAAKYQGKYRKCIIIFLVLVIVIAGGLTAYFLLKKD